HTAMLLAAAEHLARDGGFNGTLNLIFQPAEEGFGGAKKMIEDGLFQQFPCDAVFAMHNMPGLGLGKFSLRTGPALAACDPINITLHGVGGHGAMPHLTADPVVAGASIVMALQSIISRNVPPLKMGIITVGSFEAGHASNVISDRAELKLSVRSLDRDVQDMLRRRIVELVEAQAKSYGLTASFEHLLGFPVTVNSPSETDFATDVARDLVGRENLVLDMPPMTGSEDFSYMLEKVPGSFVLIGNGDKASGGPGACSLHHPGYDFDDNNITYGGAFWVKLARQFLA
ncbi:MAG: amidohydrolase, partial [Alphaproteobacteria bacterium]|nr:amidohydrolase [Alphaproteobacteria bacterium]